MKINITRKRNINGIENGAKRKRMNLIPIFSGERKNCIKNFNYFVLPPLWSELLFSTHTFFSRQPYI